MTDWVDPSSTSYCEYALGHAEQRLVSDSGEAFVLSRSGAVVLGSIVHPLRREMYHYTNECGMTASSEWWEDTPLTR